MFKLYTVAICASLLLVSCIDCLDNGLGLTPPMGWLTWERFRCIIDCENRPDECISETLITRTADLLVSEGYAAAGYEYVGIDDCWLEYNRGDDGRLVPDKKRFPRGMKFIGDYLHDKNLKFGIYEDIGTKTCAGYPGVEGTFQLDTQTFADWGADYVKLDGCYMDIEQMDQKYPEFGKYINDTGRPMLYSCSWPAYQEGEVEVDYESLAKHCNLWRNWADIDDSWESVKTIMLFFGNKSRHYQKYAGPGHWNDPDMLIIGNFGLSIDQSQVQMAVWAILAAPLLISADLATMRPEFKEIILNKQVIEVDQDPLGIAGILLFKANNILVWKREITPIVNGTKSAAIAFVNINEDGAPRIKSFSLRELEFPDGVSYIAKDLFGDKIMYINNSTDKFSVKINPTGVQMFKFTPNN